MAADTGRSLSDQQIGELLSKIRHYELSEQKYRDIQSRLDMQLDIFKRIHKCAQAAFTAENLREMSNLIAEGVVAVILDHVGKFVKQLGHVPMDILQIIEGVFSFVFPGDQLHPANVCSSDNIICVCF